MVEISGILSASILDHSNNINSKNDKNFLTKYGFICIILNTTNNNVLNIDNTTNTLNTIRNNKNIALSFIKNIMIYPEYLGKEVTLTGKYALSNINPNNSINDIFEVKGMKFHEINNNNNNNNNNMDIKNNINMITNRNNTKNNIKNHVDSSSLYVVGGTLLRMSHIQIFENNSCAIFLAIKVNNNNNKYIQKYIRKGEIIIWLLNNAVLWTPFLRIGHAYEIDSLQKMRLKQPTTTFEGLASSTCHIRSYHLHETCINTNININENMCVNTNTSTNMNFNDNVFIQNVIHNDFLFHPKSINALGQYSITPVDLSFTIDRFHHRRGMIDVDITTTDAITATNVELAIFGPRMLLEENNQKKSKLARKLSVHVPVWRDLYLLPSLYKGCTVTCSNMLPIYLWGRLRGFVLNIHSRVDILSYSEENDRNIIGSGQDVVNSENYCSVLAIWDHIMSRKILQTVRTVTASAELRRAITKAVLKQLKSSIPKEVFEPVQSSRFMEFADPKQIALMRIRGGFDLDWLCSVLPYILSSNDIYRTLSSSINCYTFSSQLLSTQDIAGIGSDNDLRVVKSELSSMPRGTGLPQTILLVGHLMSSHRLSTPTFMLETNSESDVDSHDNIEDEYHSQSTCMFTIYSVDQSCPLSIFVLGATVDLSQVSDGSIVMIYHPQAVISPKHSRSSLLSSGSGVKSDHRPLILVNASDIVILSNSNNNINTSSSSSSSTPSFAPIPFSRRGLQVPIVYPSPTSPSGNLLSPSSSTSTTAHPYSVRGILMTLSSYGSVSHIQVIGVVIHRSTHEDNSDTSKGQMNGLGKGRKVYTPKRQIVLQIRDVEHVDFITMYLEMDTNIHEWICPGTILHAKASLYTSKKDGKFYLKAQGKPNIIGFVCADEAARVIASAAKRPDKFKVEHLGLHTNSDPCAVSYSQVSTSSHTPTHIVSSSSSSNSNKNMNPRVGVVVLPPEVPLIDLVLDPNPTLTHLSSQTAVEEGKWRPRITSTTSSNSTFENYSHSRCTWSLFGTCDELYSITLGVRCQGCGYTLKREGLICQAWTCLNDPCKYYGTNETRANPEISWEAKIKFSDGTADGMMFVHGDDVFKLLQPNRFEAWTYDSSSRNSCKSRGRSTFELNKQVEYIDSNGVHLRKKRKTVVNEVNIVWKLKEYLEKAAMRKGRIHISIRADPNSNTANIHQGEDRVDGFSNYGNYFNTLASTDDDTTLFVSTPVSQLSWPDPWELEDALLQSKCEELTRVIVGNLIQNEQIYLEVCVCVKKASSFCDNGTSSVMLQRAKLPGDKSWWNEFQSVQMHRFMPIQLRAVKVKRSKPNDINVRTSNLLQKLMIRTNEKKEE